MFVVSEFIPKVVWSRFISREKKCKLTESFKSDPWFICIFVSIMLIKRNTFSVDSNPKERSSLLCGENYRIVWVSPVTDSSRFYGLPTINNTNWCLDNRADRAGRSIWTIRVIPCNTEEDTLQTFKTFVFVSTRLQRPRSDWYIRHCQSHCVYCTN